MRKLNVATAAIVVATVLAATGAAFAQERTVKITGFGAACPAAAARPLA